MAGITGVVPIATGKLDGENIQYRMIVSTPGKAVDKLPVDEGLPYRNEPLWWG
jgi:hypothetical protein